MKKLISKLKVAIVYVLDVIIPKDDKLILFSTNGGDTVSGDPRSFFYYIRDNQQEFNPYFMVTNSAHTGEFPKKYLINNNSLKSALIFIRARYLVGSHLLRDFRPFRFSKRKIYIQTWHGVGDKKIFFSMGDILHEELQAPKKHLKLVKKYGEKISFFISPSEFMSACYCRIFNLDSRKILTTGLPSIDDLVFRPKSVDLPEIYPELPKYEKVILYATTFRRDPKVTQTFPINYFPFDDMDYEDLDNFLEENKIIVLIRDHISTQAKSNLNRDRVFGLNQELCPDIHDAFQFSDLVVTDWGSVSNEFYPLRKPVIHLLYDENEYLKSPGILVDDKNFWSPGPKPKTYRDFKKSILSLLKDDVYLSRRDEISRQLFPVQDGKSAERVFDLMVSLKDKRKTL